MVVGGWVGGWVGLRQSRSQRQQHHAATMPWGTGRVACTAAARAHQARVPTKASVPVVTMPQVDTVAVPTSGGWWWGVGVGGWGVGGAYS